MGLLAGRCTELDGFKRRAAGSIGARAGRGKPVDRLNLIRSCRRRESCAVSGLGRMTLAASSNWRAAEYGLRVALIEPAPGMGHAPWSPGCSSR